MKSKITREYLVKLRETYLEEIRELEEQLFQPNSTPLLIHQTIDQLNRGLQRVELKLKQHQLCEA